MRAVGTVMAAFFDLPRRLRIALRTGTKGFRKPEKTRAERGCVLKKFSSRTAHEFLRHEDDVVSCWLDRRGDALPSTTLPWTSLRAGRTGKRAPTNATVRFYQSRWRTESDAEDRQSREAGGFFLRTSQTALAVGLGDHPCKAMRVQISGHLHIGQGGRNGGLLIHTGQHRGKLKAATRRVRSQSVLARGIGGHAMTVLLAGGRRAHPSGAQWGAHGSDEQTQHHDNGQDRRCPQTLRV